MKNKKGIMLMLKRLFLIILFCLLPTISFGAQGGNPGTQSDKVSTDTTNFNNNLSTSDTDIQKALDTIDNLTVSGAPTTLHFLTNQAEAGLSAEINLGALSTGFLYGTVAAGVSTISSVDTAAVTNGATTLATGDQIYDFTVGLGYLTGITADSPLSGAGTSGSHLTIDLSAYAPLASPTFTTQITTPKIVSAGDLTIDAVNAGATSTVYILNSGGAQVADLNVEGDLIVTDISVITGGTLQLGAAGIDGQLKIYSEQGATDYTATLNPNATMTSDANFYLPADEPAGTYLLNMTTGGVIGYDNSTYLTSEVDGSITNELPIAGNLIDISGNPASTVDVDLTEAESVTWGAGGNASNIWTFNVSGTDWTMTAGSALATFSAGVTISGTTTIGTLAGTVDAGGATSFETVNGTNPTTDAAGEIAVDSSAAPGSGIRFYGDVAYTIAGTYSKSFVILLPVATDDYPIWCSPYAITIKHIRVQCLGGTNVVAGLDEYDAEGVNPAVVDSADITATANNSVDDDGTLSNPTIDALDYVGFHVTSISGTPTSMTISFDYVIDQVN